MSAARSSAPVVSSRPTPTASGCNSTASADRFAPRSLMYVCSAASCSSSLWGVSTPCAAKNRSRASVASTCVAVMAHMPIRTSAPKIFLFISIPSKGNAGSLVDAEALAETPNSESTCSSVAMRSTMPAASASAASTIRPWPKSLWTLAGVVLRCRATSATNVSYV